MRIKRTAISVTISRVRYCIRQEKSPVILEITGFKNLSRLYQNGEPFDEPERSYISRITKKIISRLSIKPAKDHISWIKLIKSPQREIRPVAASVVISSAAMDKIPSDNTGEKSTIPMRVNRKRLNQLRYGSQMDERIRPKDEYAACGIQDSKILIKHKNK